MDVSSALFEDFLQPRDRDGPVIHWIILPVLYFNPAHEGPGSQQVDPRLTVGQQCALVARRADGSLGGTAQSTASRVKRDTVPVIHPTSHRTRRGLTPTLLPAARRSKAAKFALRIWSSTLWEGAAQ